MSYIFQTGSGAISHECYETIEDALAAGIRQSNDERGYDAHRKIKFWSYNKIIIDEILLTIPDFEKEISASIDDFGWIEDQYKGSDLVARIMARETEINKIMVDAAAKWIKENIADLTVFDTKFAAQFELRDNSWVRTL